jgi:hypothetical protein
MSGSQFLFIHGGSGWMMSRRAAERYVELEDEMRRMYQGKYVGDDVEILDFLSLVNLSWIEANSIAFEGSAIRVEDYEAVSSAKMDFGSAVTLPCTAPGELMHGIYRLNKLVFLHNGQRRDWVMEFGEQMIESAPNDIYVEPQLEDSRICTNSKGYNYSMPGEGI